MNSKHILPIILLLLLASGLGPVLGGCYGIPVGTTEEASVGQLKLKATGAGIVKAGEQKTTFKIRCALCSFQTDGKTINTPKPDAPYFLDWLCPNCGHGQIIVIESFAQVDIH